jgi:hypothetical protein
MPPWFLFWFPLGIILGTAHLSRKGWTDVAIVRAIGAALIIEVSVFLFTL